MPGTATISTIRGELFFPGDKSLSHRAVILASLAQGTSQIKNFLPAQDTLNTLKAMQTLGVKVLGDPLSGEFQMISEGLPSFGSSPLSDPLTQQALNLGNSGTGARLLMGLISGYENLMVVLDGDSSLRKRPMRRVTLPLSNFGASFSNSDHLPISITGKKLKKIDFEEELGSAQVKSALILAAISSQVELNLQEVKPSRDHTENMLEFAGIQIEQIIKNGSKEILLKPPYRLKPSTFHIWGDVSSAAFFVVLASLTGRGDKDDGLKIKDVLLNPFRTVYLDVLKKMGAAFQIKEAKEECGEIGGEIFVQYAPTHNISITPEEVPSVIDEIPILTVAAMFSKGTFQIRGAEELRYKESDRIHAICSNLSALGYNYEEYPDGFKLQGQPEYIPKGEIQGFHDHRIIMSFEIANQVAKAKSFGNNGENKDLIYLQGDSQEKEWIGTSFPEFYNKLRQVIRYKKV